MKKLAELFGSSSRELKSVRTITVCAMLAAAAIILVNFRIELTNTQRIGFSGIPNQLVAYLFGPAVSCLFAGALDIIKYLIKPVGAFFPGLTLVTMLAGLIYGFFFYKKPLKLTRVLAAHFLEKFAARNRKNVKGFAPQALDMLRRAMLGLPVEMEA